MSETLPRSAIIRVSRGRFDPGNYEAVRKMIDDTASYLVPAIQALPGLIDYYAGTSPDGWTTQVSVWESDDAGRQMATLPEMRDRARAAAEAAGVVFEPILQYPVNWSLTGR